MGESAKLALMDYPFLVPLARSIRDQKTYSLSALYTSYEQFIKECVDLKLVSYEAQNTKVKFYVVSKNDTLPDVYKEILTTLSEKLPVLPNVLQVNHAGDSVASMFRSAVVSALRIYGIPLHHESVRLYGYEIELLKFRLSGYGKNLLKKLDTKVIFTSPKLGGKELTKREIAILSGLEKHPQVLEKDSFKRMLQRQLGGGSTGYSYWDDPVKDISVSRDGSIGELVASEKITFKNFWGKVFYGVHKWRLGVPSTAVMAGATAVPFLTTPYMAPLPVIIGVFALSTLGLSLPCYYSDRSILKLNTSGRRMLEESRAWEKFKRETKELESYQKAKTKIVYPNVPTKTSKGYYPSKKNSISEYNYYRKIHDKMMYKMSLEELDS